MSFITVFDCDTAYLIIGLCLALFLYYLEKRDHNGGNIFNNDNAICCCLLCILMSAFLALSYYDGSVSQYAGSSWVGLQDIPAAIIFGFWALVNGFVLLYDWTHRGYEEINSIGGMDLNGRSNGR